MSIPSLPKSFTTRSVYGAAMLNAINTKSNYEPLTFTTLNEKFSVHASTQHPIGLMCEGSWFAIGNKGHGNVQGVDGIGLSHAKPHAVTDAVLFGHLPFIIRDINDDISASEREKYGMRAIIDVGGVKKIGYYLMYKPSAGIPTTIKRIVINNGQETISDFIPDSSVLNPQPPSFPLPPRSESNSEDYAVFKYVPFTLTASEVQEILNAAEIIYGDQAYAIISEIAWVGGVRTTVGLLDANNNPTSTQYYECLKSTIITSITSRHDLVNANGGIEIDIRIGTSEPLYGPSQTSVEDNL